jgi:ppGpp synthetase/RelA/SpoT-type nucleotidyltranferase
MIFVGDDLPFELQIRTRNQHRWARLSEAVATRLDSEVKYGGGPESVRRALLLFSEAGAELDEGQRLARLAESRHLNPTMEIADSVDALNVRSRP